MKSPSAQPAAASSDDRSATMSAATGAVEVRAFSISIDGFGAGVAAAQVMTPALGGL